MAKNEQSEEELDEHGLVVQKYESMVLVVVPTKGFAETTLRYVRSALYNVHVGTRSVALADEGLLEGDMQDEFQPDGLVADARMEDFSGVVFCGGRGALELADDGDAQRLAREAVAQNKLIAAWGLAPAVLARAGVVKGVKMTADPSLKDELVRAGARWSPSQVESHRGIVTAIDDAAGLRFSRALVQLVAI